MSLLNPSAAYRRSTSRPKIPVVLPLVRVIVDGAGVLKVTVDEESLPDEMAGLTRSELHPLLDRIAAERGSALRVEIHEPDGKVFTDFHAPEPTTATHSTPEPAPHSRRTRERQPSVNVHAGCVTGEGFQPDEQVVVAIVVHRATSNSDGTLDLHLPEALLDRQAGEIVLVGERSGAHRAKPAGTETPKSAAS